MKKRVFNFAAGPATLPLEVLEASAAALVDFQGKGFGIAECSHRGKEFDAVLDETIARCRTLLAIPDTHDVLFLQGGATQQFVVIPMNFLSGPADYVVSGEWSKKAADTAKGLAGDKIRVIASSEATQFDRLPTPINADANALRLSEGAERTPNRTFQPAASGLHAKAGGRRDTTSCRCSLRPAVNAPARPSTSNFGGRGAAPWASTR